MSPDPNVRFPPYFYELFEKIIEELKTMNDNLKYIERNMEAI